MTENKKKYQKMLNKKKNPKIDSKIMVVYFMFIISILSLHLLLNIDFYMSFLEQDFLKENYMRVGVFAVFILSCYISAFSTKILNPAYGIKKESIDILKLNKNNPNIKHKKILKFFFVISLFLFLLNTAKNLDLRTDFMVSFIIFLSLSTIYQALKKDMMLLRWNIRYALEIPKLYFSLILLNIKPELSLILIIISIGSWSYFYIPRGVFALEAFWVVLFILFNHTFNQTIGFIILNRIIGTIVILIPYLIKDIYSKVKKPVSKIQKPI